MITSCHQEKWACKVFDFQRDESANLQKASFILVYFLRVFIRLLRLCEIKFGLRL